MVTLVAIMVWLAGALSALLALCSLVCMDGGIGGTYKTLCAMVQLAFAICSVAIAGAAAIALTWMSPLTWGVCVGYGAIAGTVLFIARGGTTELWHNEWAVALNCPLRCAGYLPFMIIEVMQDQIRQWRHRRKN